LVPPAFWKRPEPVIPFTLLCLLGTLFFKHVKLNVL
jgi:hypothetical protein